MSETFIEARREFLAIATAYLRTIEGEKTELKAEYRLGRGDVSALVLPILKTLLNEVATAPCIRVLNRYAPNPYYFVVIASMATAICEDRQFIPSDVHDVVSRLRASYPDQQLLAKVNTGEWHLLTAEELALARADALIISDLCWPFPNDQDRLNPVYSED